MPFPLKKLRKILKSFGAWEEPSRGKGGHTAFLCEVEGHTELFPLPNKREVADPYVKAVRRKFKLTEDDGVSDDEFFGRG